MTFAEHIRIKIPAILKAFFGLAVFICADYSIFFLFAHFGWDREIYKGLFNTLACVAVFLCMLVVNKISAKLDAPLIKIGKLSPDQVAALIIIGFGMLGFVSTYMGIANKISEYFAPVGEAVEEYRENVDRYSEIEQITVPLWDSLLYAFTLSFIVPITEEMSFRGVIFGELRKGFGPWLSVIISAIIFGVMHGVSIHIGYAIVCGLIIASVYHLTGSLISSIILHMVFNIFGSGLQNIFELEQLNVPDELYVKIFLTLNTATILFMPIAVVAFAYLVHVKRKKDAKQKELAEYIAAREAEKAAQADEENTDELETPESPDTSTATEAEE